jgi:hypothetical protein
MVSDTFSISGAANYETLMEQNLAQTFVEQKGMGKGKAVAAIQKGTQFQFKSLEQSRLSYASSERLQFSMELLFVAIKSTDDPRVQASAFLEGCYPRELAGVFGITPPWGYDWKKPSGVMGVKIGKWFSAPNQVLTRAEFNFSKEVVRSGCPLYAQGSVSFEPYKQVSSDELLKFFVGL